MPRLARPASELRPEYDVVVVGSGYGGGVAASRLARMGLKVAVLERGREFLPGDFPADVLAAQRELQMSGQLLGRQYRIGSPTALVDVRLGDDVHVVQGCGLGGTSLINANVCLAPDETVFDDPVWPEPLRLERSLLVGFARARAMLQPRRLPDRIDPLKLQNLGKAATALGAEVERVPLHIAFDAGVNAAGVQQPACTLCGDCMGGCNVGAKTTVHSTYLTDAVNFAADLFTGATVRAVAPRRDGRWRVVLSDAAAIGTKIVPVRTVVARIVVLAAGTLGTGEILMRSRDQGLALSDRLGRQVSTNGDAVAFGWNNQDPVNAIGVGHPARAKVPAPGPAVAGLVDLRRRKNPSERLAIVEAAIQSAVAPFLPIALGLGSILGEQVEHQTLEDVLRAAHRAGKSLLGGSYTGAVHSTQVFLAIGQDSAAGELAFDNDRVSIRWPGAAEEPVYRQIESTLRRMAAATGGTYMPNPVTTRLLGGNLLTVHPLGGCAMAADRAAGVVDHMGRVFDASPGKSVDAVHDGLYVCDGSAMARSLGVHPLLTITALAERSMYHLARSRDLVLDTTPLPNAPARQFHGKVKVRTTPRAAAACTNPGSGVPYA